MTESELSRRMFLHGTVAGVCGLSVGAAAAQVITKSPQQVAGYQDRPNGADRCSNCLNFQPPSSCKVVAGRISPDGWCRIYAVKHS
jgi:hypothetical protein